MSPLDYRSIWRKQHLHSILSPCQSSQPAPFAPLGTGADHDVFRSRLSRRTSTCCSASWCCTTKSIESRFPSSASQEKYIVAVQLKFAKVLSTTVFGSQTSTRLRTPRPLAHNVTRVAPAVALPTKAQWTRDRLLVRSSLLIHFHDRSHRTLFSTWLMPGAMNTTSSAMRRWIG